MCLAIPGRVIERFDENGLVMGKVDFGGTVSTVCLVYVPEVAIGQYVIVHAGFAINALDEAEAARTLEVWREYMRATDSEGTA